MSIKAIIGLGNPGPEYKNTYHNVGTLFIDFLLDKFKTEEKGEERTFEWEKMGLNGEELVLIKTKLFMNESGKAVKDAIKKFKVKPNEILLVQDESDIILGDFKYSFARSSAGHRGVQSVIDLIGTNEFHRLRIGIRKKAGKALDFVLKKIGKADEQTFNKVFISALERLESLSEK